MFDTNVPEWHYLDVKHKIIVLFVSNSLDLKMRLLVSSSLRLPLGEVHHSHLSCCLDPRRLPRTHQEIHWRVDEL